MVINSADFFPLRNHTKRKISASMYVLDYESQRQANKVAFASRLSLGSPTAPRSQFFGPFSQRENYEQFLNKVLLKIYLL
jgi:hypothetical protein